MNRQHKALFALAAILLTGCTHTTPINNLPLPPATMIEGTVTHINDNGFGLKDGTGSIFVKAKLPNNKPLGISLGEPLKICGNLQGGDTRIFDGYVINKPSGQQIIVSRPTPHFGFIIQGAVE